MENPSFLDDIDEHYLLDIFIGINDITPEQIAKFRTKLSETHQRYLDKVDEDDKKRVCFLYNLSPEKIVI